VVGAGSTHFMMNHTTGGAKMGGHNVRALTVNGLYEMDPSDLSPSESVQTAYYYNVLHPVNKRAIASLCIPAAKVNTWYKNAYLPAPAVMYSDTFMAYRQNLVPAGTHKAYVAMLALRAIGDASLIPFLPDPNVVEQIIQTYERIREAGARAHVGSRYYTGEPPSVSQADVDMFLPFAAYFVQTRMRSASLAASPHLSVEHAASAPTKWKNIIDLTVKTSADSAPAEQIIAYLVQNGAQGIRFDLNTNEGISDAGAFNDALVKRIAKAI